ncbi:MAG: alpha/beta hydrolase [Spirochaetes bacterium]|nr:alpha/beta hydrolase [Spirochaetota bacterium]MBU0956772.1 alpha/beta hydrolase [Spirochaetota bacterium]
MNNYNQIKTEIKGIPAIIWGSNSAKIYIYVHGKMSNKESAERFAETAIQKGYQVISFDLPEHGERADINYKCNVWNGVNDLKVIEEYVQKRWSEIYLFGCSLGAYFSLLAYQDIPLKKCLFQSPILDMEYLINKMFTWFNITEDELEKKREIITAVDTLSWDYYCYVKKHKIKKWDVPTRIIFGTNDNFQSQEIINKFANEYYSVLTALNGCEHYFNTEESSISLEKWLKENI